MRKFLNRKTILIAVLALVILLSGATAYYFYAKYQNVKKNPELITQEETAWLVSKVSRLMVLPSGQPTVATVLDKEKVKDQEFFKNAENGDKILVYMDAKKAILYRPSTDKIIEISPFAGTPARVTLLNGSKVKDATSTAQTKIKDVADINITNNDDIAQNKNYTKTIVVDLSGNFSAQAEQIATLLGGEVGTLPAGENKLDTDVMVFVAQ